MERLPIQRLRLRQAPGLVMLQCSRERLGNRCMRVTQSTDARAGPSRGKSEYPAEPADPAWALVSA